MLRYSDVLPIAVIEAKDESHEPGAGLQQAISYAEALDVLFAYSTNGHSIVEFDRITNSILHPYCPASRCGKEPR